MKERNITPKKLLHSSEKRVSKNPVKIATWVWVLVKAASPPDRQPTSSFIEIKPLYFSIYMPCMTQISRTPLLPRSAASFRGSFLYLLLPFSLPRRQWPSRWTPGACPSPRFALTARQRMKKTVISKIYLAINLVGRGYLKDPAPPPGLRLGPRTQGMPSGLEKGP